MKKPLILILLLSFIAGCATARSVRYPNNMYAPTSPERIVVYRNFPPGEYEIIGEVAGSGAPAATWDSVGKFMRDEAAKIGGHAIVIQQQSSPYVGTYHTPGQIRGSTTGHWFGDLYTADTTFTVNPGYSMPMYAKEAIGVVIRFKKHKDVNFKTGQMDRDLKTDIDILEKKSSEKKSLEKATDIARADIPRPDGPIKEINIKEFAKLLCDSTEEYICARDELILALSPENIINQMFEDESFYIYTAHKKFRNTYKQLLSKSCKHEQAENLRRLYLRAFKNGIIGTNIVQQSLQKSSTQQVPYIKKAFLQIDSGMQFLNNSLGDLKKFVKQYYPEGIPYLLPSIKINFLYTNKKLSNKAYLGIQYLQSRKEIIIIYTNPNSPAERAGLQAFDIILGKHKGENFPTIIELMDFLVKHKPSDMVKFDVRREGKNIVVEVELGERVNKGS